jgi:soluble lytic murein transglycosylase-like protein
VRLRGLVTGIAVLCMATMPAAAQSLRPTLPNAAPSARELVMVQVSGGAAARIATHRPLIASIERRREQFQAMVVRHAKANDVPEHLVHRVIMRESKYQPELIGRGGTIGMMQIKLATARGMGFTGTAEDLRDPDVNLTWAVKYLAGAWRAAAGDSDRAVRNYAAGYYVRKNLRREAAAQ